MKSLPIRLFEAYDYPVRWAELEKVSSSLMKAGFTEQAEKVKEVCAAFEEYIVANDLDLLLVDGMDGQKEAASAPDRMQTKLRFKRLQMRHKKTKKKWLCCKKPKLKKLRSGGRVWQSTCRYRDLKNRRIRVLNMMLSRDVSKKPKFVTIKDSTGKGKRIRWCTGQAAK